VVFLYSVVVLAYATSEHVHVMTASGPRVVRYQELCVRVPHETNCNSGLRGAGLWLRKDGQLLYNLMGNSIMGTPLTAATPLTAQYPLWMYHPRRLRDQQPVTSLFASLTTIQRVCSLQTVYIGGQPCRYLTAMDPMDFDFSAETWHYYADDVESETFTRVLLAEAATVRSVATRRIITS